MKERPSRGAANSTVLVVPRVKLRIKAQPSIPLLSHHYLLRERFLPSTYLLRRMQFYSFLKERNLFNTGGFQLLSSCRISVGDASRSASLRTNKHKHRTGYCAKQPTVLKHHTKLHELCRNQHATEFTGGRETLITALDSCRIWDTRQPSRTESRVTNCIHATRF
jgi:hypothetical protein